MDTTSEMTEFPGIYNIPEIPDAPPPPHIAFYGVRIDSPQEVCRAEEAEERTRSHTCVELA
jgi:hypothetical protein